MITMRIQGHHDVVIDMFFNMLLENEGDTDVISSCQMFYNIVGEELVFVTFVMEHSSFDMFHKTNVS